MPPTATTEILLVSKENVLNDGGDDGNTSDGVCTSMTTLKQETAPTVSEHLIHRKTKSALKNSPKKDENNEQQIDMIRNSDSSSISSITNNNNNNNNYNRNRNANLDEEKRERTTSDEDKQLKLTLKETIKNINNNNNCDSVSHNTSDGAVIETRNKIASNCDRENEQNQQSSDIFKPQLRWPDLIVQIFLHLGFLYGLYLLFFVKFFTFMWFLALIVGSGFGITAGAHRLWSHRSYKAKFPLRLLLILLFTVAGQRDAYTWALDHRVHHKYSETVADPHNAKRGFFFAHVGWLFLTPHPEVVAKRNVIDMSDLEKDKVVMWQRTFYIPLFALLAIAFPVIVPWYFWNESLWMSFWVNFNCRFCVTLNIAFFVNSVAHMWGKRPYDKKISPVENISVAIAALGEGWHNYHHVFPWDYKTGEFGDYKLNITTAFIDAFAKLGWAYDRKSVSPDMVARRAAKCGDGTHFLSDELAHDGQCWGYGDEDIPEEDRDELERMSH